MLDRFLLNERFRRHVFWCDYSHFNKKNLWDCVSCAYL